MRTTLFLAALSSCVLLPLAAGSAEEVTTGLTDLEGTPFAEDEPAQAKSAVIEDGTTVHLEYILTLDDGTIVENNIMGNPLVFEQGSGAVFAAMEKALAGMKRNDRKKITLSPEEAYGAVNPAQIKEIDTALIPEEARTAGFNIVSTDPQGNKTMVRVVELRGDRTLIDFNHPLAGQALHFDLRVLGVGDPTRLPTPAPVPQFGSVQ